MTHHSLAYLSLVYLHVYLWFFPFSGSRTTFLFLSVPGTHRTKRGLHPSETDSKSGKCSAMSSIDKRRALPTRRLCSFGTTDNARELITIPRKKNSLLLFSTCFLFYLLTRQSDGHSGRRDGRARDRSFPARTLLPQNIRETQEREPINLAF